MIFSSLLTSSQTDAEMVKISSSNEPIVENTFSQMKFQTCEEVEQYFKNYALENNFAMRRGGSRSEKGQKIMQLYECSSSRVNRKPKLVDGDAYTIGNNKDESIVCSCKWRARAWRKLSEESGSHFWYISSWVNEHSHELGPDLLKSPESKNTRVSIKETKEGREKKIKQPSISKPFVLKPESELQIIKGQKRRYATLIGLCKEWCDLNAESHEVFERAQTLITNDLSVAQVELLYIPNSSTEDISSVVIMDAPESASESNTKINEGRTRKRKLPVATSLPAVTNESTTTNQENPSVVVITSGPEHDLLLSATSSMPHKKRDKKNLTSKK